ERSIIMSVLRFSEIFLGTFARNRLNVQYTFSLQVIRIIQVASAPNSMLENRTILAGEKALGANFSRRVTQERFLCGSVPIIRHFQTASLTGGTKRFMR